MSDVIETKISRIGNSLWALIPKDIVNTRGLKEGERIKISIMGQNRQQALKVAFGYFKGAKEFKRKDHGDRVP